MKYTVVFFLLISHATIAQLSLGGFNEIKLGSSYESLKSEITEVENPPPYAWFAPMTMDRFMELSGEDSSAFFEMLETDRILAESLNTKIVWCTFNKKEDADFFYFPIECAQLIFKNDILMGISVVFDKDDMTYAAKRKIVQQLEEQLGDGLKYHNRGNPYPDFEREWKQGQQEVSVGDKHWDINAKKNESLNIFFEQN